MVPRQLLRRRLRGDAAKGGAGAVRKRLAAAKDPESAGILEDTRKHDEHMKMLSDQIAEMKKSNNVLTVIQGAFLVNQFRTEQAAWSAAHFTGHEARESTPETGAKH